ncbi:NADPH dehydrogenase NamA [Brevibacillus sp. B_LB10_24]|jgi:NADPH2 dehydrogenase|uniref:NADPH dehydrogenase NamA n=1 Tax=Brevibacillus TaxID=55080 RepID=UPI000314190A|nr:NADPH dehydrogenase NamA [Brevibacillus massiliensis]
MNRLFQPLQVKGMQIKNRIVMSPMCQYSADQDGRVTDWHRVHYPARAVGGVGLVIVEATAVQANGRISSRDLGIWHDDHIAGLAEIVRLVKANGAAIGIQLAHAGRKAEKDVPGVHEAPSAIPFSDAYETPTALDLQGIAEVVSNFQQAAVRAGKAGFDVIEIHAAHGYLINQFLSPLTNRREDEYGGDPDKRFRLLKEIVLAVKEVWQGPLFVRVSAEEYHPDGNHIEQYVDYAKRLKELGVDLIDASSGAVVPYRIDAYPGYQVPLAEKIRQGAGIATGAVGLITTAAQAEEILQKDQADLIFLGRELLRNPYWPLHAGRELEAPDNIPQQYLRAF